jgi:hypothetical protein
MMAAFDVETLIQATVSVAFWLIGVATGVLLQREATAVLTTGKRGRWPWLTSQRVMAFGVMLICVFGILTAVSVRSCQARYNEAFGHSTAQSRAATDLLYDALADLTVGVSNPDPAVRQAAFTTFSQRIAEARQLRKDSPLPAQPEC